MNFLMNFLEPALSSTFSKNFSTTLSAFSPYLGKRILKLVEGIGRWKNREKPPNPQVSVGTQSCTSQPVLTSARCSSQLYQCCLRIQTPFGQPAGGHASEQDREANKPCTFLAFLPKCSTFLATFMALTILTTFTTPSTTKRDQ